MEGISKSFSGVAALSGVNLEVGRGEVHALMGENGAGKSTLMRILSGIVQKDAGRICLDGKAVEREKDLQILFKLVWEGSPSSVDAEVNNGRGPVDFKISRGARDGTLVEFKLASNSQLERNLENQVAIYEKANNITQSYKVILFFTEHQELTVRSILRRLKTPTEAGIILIDARPDNKPSASKA